MLGILGTILVIAQMAALAFGFAPQSAMAIGLVGSIIWMGYARQKQDICLAITNASVGGFALWGLI